MVDDDIDKVCDLLSLSKGVQRQDLAEFAVQGVDLGPKVDVVFANLVAGALNLGEFVVFGYCHGIYLWVGGLCFGEFMDCAKGAEGGYLSSDCRVPAIGGNDVG